MSVDKKILEEIRRVKFITKYITEQDAPPAEDPLADLGGGAPEGGDVDPLTGGAPAGSPPADPAAAGAPPADPAAAGAPPADPAAAGPQPIDTATDPDVEEVGAEGEEEEEELDITDLVTAQKNIEDKQEEYFQNLFKQLEAMDTKLKEMDGLTNRLTSIEDKIEKYKPKTPQEKLELRSLDSGPFKQKLSDFFVDKQEEMEKSGKNEYVLTTDQVKEFSPNQIEDSFNEYGEEDEDMM
jgi:hypothetical protein